MRSETSTSSVATATDRSIAASSHSTPLAGSSSSGGGPRMLLQCAGCDGPILDRFLLNVLDRVWHIKCVQCSDCRCMLADKCFSRDGQLFCREDFFMRYGTKCGGCGQGISPNDLVRRARQNVYHLKCFTCSVCHKQLTTGEQLFVVDDNQFICKDDFIATKLHSGFNDVTDSADADCARPDKMDDTFSDRDVITPSCIAREPPSCFNDDSSGRDSPSLSLPPHSTIPFPIRSSGGSLPSTGSDWPLPGGVTPPSCVGDVIGDGSSALLNDDCSLDSNSSCGDDTNGSLGGGGANTSGSNNNNNNNNEKKETGSGNNDGTQSGGTAGAKRRGPRTTIKAKQLETLKSAFAATPKPTRHIREQLAQETGLNMRVIQVWFQNRRSKERRMKQLSAMGARRQFFRNPRRLRALRPGEEFDAVDILGPAALGYFTDNCDFYPAYPPPPGFNDFFHHGSSDPSQGGFLTPPTSGGAPHIGQPMPDHLTSQIHDAMFLPAELILPGQQAPAVSLAPTSSTSAPGRSTPADVTHQYTAAAAGELNGLYTHHTQLQMTETW